MVLVQVSVGEIGIVLTIHLILHLIRRNLTLIIVLLLTVKHLMITLLVSIIRRLLVLERNFTTIQIVEHPVNIRHLLL